MSNAPRAKEAKRDWGSDDSQTPILHIDMDAFFAEVELLFAPQLRGLPVVVGGVGGRGVVTSATYQARAYGVRAGMPTMRARSLCPQAVFLPTRHGTYSRVSAQVMGILSEVTPVLEQVSVDEAYLDVSGSTRRLGSPVQIAQLIRRRIRKELQLPASVGIGANKLVAKLGSSNAKPDGLLLIPADRTRDFLNLLPVGALPGVGGKTAQTLHARGVESVLDLSRIDLSRLRRWLGDAHAFRLFQLAQGIDRRPVVTDTVEKSVGAETTFSENIDSPQLLREVTLDLADQTATRLRRKKLLAATVAIKLRDKDFHTVTRSRTLPVPTDVTAEIFAQARDLIEAERIPSGGYRLLGVRAENLHSLEKGVQAALDDDPRRRLAEAAMDQVRERFGKGAVKPAALLKRDGPTRP